MKSNKLGKSTSNAEVLNVSKYGIWLLVEEHEYFLPYKEFNWFENASIKELSNVQLLHGRHLYWKDLDVDLELDSIRNLGAYPLRYVA